MEEYNTSYNSYQDPYIGAPLGNSYSSIGRYIDTLKATWKIEIFSII